MHLAVTPRLHVIGSGALGLSHPTDAHAYLLDGGTEQVLIDAGSGLNSDALARNVRDAVGSRMNVRRLLLTHSHWDHARGAAGAKERFGLEVSAHRDVRVELEERLWDYHLVHKQGYRAEPCALDSTLTDGQVVSVGDLSIRVIETPGHTTDGLSFVCEIDGRTYLFSGDTLLGEGSIGAAWASSDFGAFLQSLESMAAAEPDALMPGHRMFTVSNAQVGIQLATEQLRATWHGFQTQGHAYFPSWWLSRYGAGVDDLDMGGERG